MPRNGKWSRSISSLTQAPGKAGGGLAREFGLTLSQIRALVMLVGDDPKRLSDAALRLKGLRPAWL